MFLSHKVDMKHSGFKGSCYSGVRLPIKNSELFCVRAISNFDGLFVCIIYTEPWRKGETEDFFFFFLVARGYRLEDIG